VTICCIRNFFRDGGSSSLGSIPMGGEGEEREIEIEIYIYI
jgi:hypothetical protein